MQESWQVNGVVGIFTRLEKGFVSVPVGLIVSLICNTRIAFRKQTCNVPYISCLLPNLNLKIFNWPDKRREGQSFTVYHRLR